MLYASSGLKRTEEGLTFSTILVTAPRFSGKYATILVCYSIQVMCYVHIVDWTLVLTNSSLPNSRSRNGIVCDSLEGLTLITVSEQ